MSNKRLNITAISAITFITLWGIAKGSVQIGILLGTMVALTGIAVHYIEQAKKKTSFISKINILTAYIIGGMLGVMFQCKTAYIIEVLLILSTIIIIHNIDNE